MAVKKKTTAKRKTTTTAKSKTATKRKVVAKKATTKKATTRKTTAKKATPKKKTTVKKVVAKKKTAVKKAAPVKKVAVVKLKTTPITEPVKKSAMMKELAEYAGITKNEVGRVFEGLENFISRSMKKRGVGTFTIPGLLKIAAVHKPAKKARKGINPFTGEETMFKAKPAHYVVKARALKKLKEMAGK